MTITAATWGTVYLLHLSRPLSNTANPRAMAPHYIGWADDLEARLAEHRAGQGSHITRAAVAQGIELVLVATWHAPLGLRTRSCRCRNYGGATAWYPRTRARRATEARLAHESTNRTMTKVSDFLKLLNP